MPHMSKKTFEAVAGVISGVEMPGEVRDRLVTEFISVFRADNARFHAGLFIDACEPVKASESGRPVVRFGEV